MYLRSFPRSNSLKCVIPGFAGGVMGAFFQSITVRFSLAFSRLRYVFRLFLWLYSTRSFSYSCAISETKSSFKVRSEEHTSELQSRGHLVCRLLLEIKK